MRKSKIWSSIGYFVADALIIIGFIFLSTLSTIHSTKDATDVVNTIGLTILFSSVVSLVIVSLFLLFGVYRFTLKTIGFFEFLRIYAISFVVLMVSYIPLYLLKKDLPCPNIWPWLTCSLSIGFFLCAIRYIYHVFQMFRSARKGKTRIRTLLVGAGVMAKVFFDETLNNKNSKNKVVAFIDDDVNKIGGTLSNLPIKGPISDIATVIDYYAVEEVVICISDLSQEKLHEILEYLKSCNVRVRRMPLLSEMNGPNDTRVIDVNLYDLLSRDPISLNNKKMETMLKGQCVMVTGAGGSIGSELVRQIFATHPKRLVLFDIYENSTYDIQQELVREMRNKNIKDIELVTLIGSTYNEKRVEQIIKKYRPDYIYHAAAYKHVPLMEDSPAEAIRTNVIGTYNVAKMADKYNVKKMLLVSTDKAVRPTNVMGATKRFAETIIQYFANKSKHTFYCAVRFGNVLGSNGSVIPLFKKQIEEGGPVTVTDKRITRFFMTIPEAVSLIIQSSIYATGGEIFILDMGEPVKIINLAEKMIRQAGYIPYRDINIVVTGLRPGEKLYEEILIDYSQHTKTAHKKIYVEQKSEIFPIEEEIQTISKVFDLDENEDIKSLLKSIITTYKEPDEVNKEAIEMHKEK